MKKKYVLVTGATGQLGSDIVDELNRRGIPNIGVGSADLNITDDTAVTKFFNSHKLSYVIHCAAYTKVDLAEDEKKLNFEINVHGTSNIVSDQIGSPTYTYDVAKAVVDMISTDKYGIYHLTNEGYVSWADFAREIFKKTNKSVKVNNVTTEEYNAKAKRPKNSRLDKTKSINAGFKKMPTWQDALDRYLKEINVI